MAKRAFIDFDGGEVLRHIGCLLDHGLCIVGSLDTPSHLPGIVRLIVEGDMLPDKCAHSQLFQIMPIITTEAYGQQRITRVAELQVV